MPKGMAGFLRFGAPSGFVVSRNENGSIHLF